MVEKIDPYLMIILPRMFETITREITFTLMKSARSGLINTARDFSSGIVTGDGRLFMIEEGQPVHLEAYISLSKKHLNYSMTLPPAIVL